MQASSLTSSQLIRSIAVVHPLPWSVETDTDGLEVRFCDANNSEIIWGNVCAGIEFNHPCVPELLHRMLSDFVGAVADPSWLEGGKDWPPQ